MTTTYHSKTIKLFGPPGTGKTTTLMNRIEKYIERGVRPNEIAYFSFTKVIICSSNGIVSIGIFSFLTYCFKGIVDIKL